MNANASYAYNDIDQTRYNVGISNDTATAEFESQQFGVGATIGRDIEVINRSSNSTLVVTPQLNANFVHVDVDDYTETGAGGLSLQNVDTEDFQALDLGVSVNAQWEIQRSEGDSVLPAVHAGYSYDVINDNVESTASFTGGGASFKTEGFEPDEHSFNVGGGLTYLSTESWEFKAEYDFEYKEDYHAHSGLARATYKF